MNNVFNIAKKELVDLIGSKIIIIVLIVYFLFVCIGIYNFYDTISNNATEIVLNGSYELGVESYALSNALQMLTYYGAIVAIIVGVSSMACEREGNALSTLITKPLYRDTIINGKLLGTIGFLLIIFGFTAAIYTSCIYALYGSTLARLSNEYLLRLSIIILIALVYVLLFFALSMALSIIIKDQAFAMMLSLIAMYVINQIRYVNVSWFIACIITHDPFEIDNIMSAIADTSPDGLIYNLSNIICDTSRNVLTVMQYAMPKMLILLVYAVISLSLCYILFIRRDIV